MYERKNYLVTRSEILKSYSSLDWRSVWPSMFHVMQYRINRTFDVGDIAFAFNYSDLDIVVSYVSETVCPTESLKQFILQLLTLMASTRGSHLGLEDVENLPVRFLAAALETAFNYEVPHWVSAFTELSLYVLPGVTTNPEVWIVLQ